MNLVNRTLEYLQDRRNKLLNGGINSIPSPFVRFRSAFVGIEQGKYYTITGSTKSAKTQFASFMFLYTPLLYAYNNPDKIRLKIFYYALEENPEDVTKRFMSYLLNTLTDGSIHISPTDLQSTDNSKPVSQEVLDVLKSEEFQKILTFYEEHIEFSTSRNATGVYQEVKRYMEEHGVVHKRPQLIKDDFGGTKEVQVFDWYEPNDPDEFVIVFYDHLSLIQTERDMTLKQSADKLSEYFVILRNRYNVSPVLIQQQAFAGESLDAFKSNKLRPTAANLADSKYSARDTNILLGLFSPFKHELPECNKYDITKLRDNFRLLEVILNRGGSCGDVVGLFFDGAVCDWAELPRPENTVEMQKVYNYINRLSAKQPSSKLFFIYSKLINLWEKL